MKPLFALPLLLLFLLFACTATYAQKAEDDAIKKVIQQETNAYFHKNYDDWAQTWAHDSAAYVMRTGTTYSSQVMGWNAIAAEYKQDMDNMSVMSEAAITPYLNKTDYNIYINGNMAAVTFKEGNGWPNPETRTLVKQNGSWKILNMTLIDKGSYVLLNACNRMKALAGKWELDENSFKNESANKYELKNAKLELRVAPNGGLEQLTDYVYSSNNQTFAPPTEYEYFIPDYSTGNFTYMDVQKTASGETYTSAGKVTSDEDNSYTITTMSPNNPSVILYQYTVSLKDGKWHQVIKSFGSDGKQNGTVTFDMHRM